MKELYWLLAFVGVSGLLYVGISVYSSAAAEVPAGAVEVELQAHGGIVGVLEIVVGAGWPLIIFMVLGVAVFLGFLRYGRYI